VLSAPKRAWLNLKKFAKIQCRPGGQQDEGAESTDLPAVASIHHIGPLNLIRSVLDLNIAHCFEARRQADGPDVVGFQRAKRSSSDYRV
jgi:hypothetical protein